jgi:hypothetical protein
MNFQMKSLSKEPKWKLITLGGFAVVLVVVFYVNVLAPSSDAPQVQPQGAVRAAAPDLGGPAFGAPAPETRQRPPLKGRAQSARPEFKLGIGDKQPDPASVDPTLRLDLLAKVQSVGMAGGVRNLFQFGQPPKPKVPEPKIPVPITNVNMTPTPPPGPPPTPPPPPITLKFYGYAAPAPSGAKRVFFLDGDEIIVASEGQLVKSRYKVLRIGINSVVVEDVQFKHEQTLPLQEQKETTG